MWRKFSDLVFTACGRVLGPFLRRGKRRALTARDQAHEDLIQFREARNRSGDSYPLW